MASGRQAIKIVTLALFLALIPASASAGLIKWAKQHKRFLLMEGAALAGAGVHAAGLHHCRRTNGVEPCDEHYGAAWAAFGFDAGLTTIVFPAAAEGCWKGENGKFCYLVGYTGSVAQTAWGIHEWRIHDEEKPDLSRVTFVRH